MDLGLHQTVLHSTPVAQGYAPVLGNRDLLADLLKSPFAVTVSGPTGRVPLKARGGSYQQPGYREVAREEPAGEFLLNHQFPRIQRLAQEMGADRGCEEEAGVGVMTRSGRTWGEVGPAPAIPVARERGGYHRLSMLTPAGPRPYPVTSSKVNSDQDSQWLLELSEGRPRPLILGTDQAACQQAQAVRELVRAPRSPWRVFLLPQHCLELNPEEQVGNEIKNTKMGKQPVKGKRDLGKRLFAALQSLQKCTKRIQSFFELPDTQYILANVG